MRRALVFLLTSLPLATWGRVAPAADRPNILWLIAEAFGPELGCYGTPQVWSPHLDRLVLSCIMEIDHRGEIVGYDLCEGVIRSTERMTYTAVNAVLEGDETQRTRYAPLVANFELMRDLAVLEEQLRTTEDAMGEPASRYQDPLAERLWRAGVSDQKIEDFGAWTRILSGLISDDSRDESQLSRIVAAEEAGLKLLADLVASLRGRNHKSLEETSLPEACRHAQR